VWIPVDYFQITPLKNAVIHTLWTKHHYRDQNAKFQAREIKDLYKMAPVESKIRALVVYLYYLQKPNSTVYQAMEKKNLLKRLLVDLLTLWIEYGSPIEYTHEDFIDKSDFPAKETMNEGVRMEDEALFSAPLPGTYT